MISVSCGSGVVWLTMKISEQSFLQIFKRIGLKSLLDVTVSNSLAIESVCFG